MKKKILEFRPTQMALGMKEVEFRVKTLTGMKGKERDEYLHDRPVPFIIGPDGRIFLVDHHHLARACWELGIEEIPVEMKADLSHLSLKELWPALRQSHWLYPFDQFGNGPHDPMHLPENIKCLADDPYRSLAWSVRQKGGYDKNETPFSEFQWAGFFRKNLKAHPSFEEFDSALTEAMKLVSTPAAKGLPGFKATK